jgi:T5SS/PEP-CTERM-associated repeat protein
VNGANSRWTGLSSLDVGGGSAGHGEGQLTIAAGGLVSASSVNVEDTGLVLLDEGTLRASSVDVNAGGVLRGSGTVSAPRYGTSFQNAGIVRPGSPGLTAGGELDVFGDYVQEHTGAFLIGIGGAGSSQYDKMAVTDGTATLDGILMVSLMPGYVPAVGDSFTILTTPLGGLSGKFSTMSWLPLPEGKRWSVVYDYEPWRPGVLPSVILKVLAPIEGDFDGDGVVDRDDFLAWKTNFGLIGSATHAQGDADGDHDVDGADFLVWQRQLGVGAIARVEGSVPEPSGVALVLIAALGFCTRTRRN